MEMVIIILFEGMSIYHDHDKVYYYTLGHIHFGNCAKLNLILQKLDHLTCNKILELV